MKKKLLFFFVWAVCAIVLQAQVYRPCYGSAKSFFPECDGTGVIVRNYSDDNLIVHHLSSSDPYVHHFAYQRQDVDDILEISLRLGGLAGDVDTAYSVLDMRVLGDTCYFCGNQMVTYGRPLYDINGNIIDNASASKGILGYFSIVEMLEGNPHVNIAILDSAMRLTRLAVRRPPEGAPNLYRVLVAAVGVTQGDTSCVVEARLAEDGSWSRIQSVPKLPYRHDRFTDIITTSQSIIVSAISSANPYSSGCNWNITLHEAPAEGFGMRFGLTSVDEHPMCYDFSSTDCGWGQHADDAEVRMCEMQSGKFALSFGSVNRNTDASGIVVAQFSGYDVMTSLNAISSSPHPKVRDMAYAPQHNVLGVLAYNNVYTHGGVFLTPISSPAQAHVFLGSGMRLWSLAHYTRGTIIAGGHEVMSVRVACLWQDPSTVRTPQCAEVDDCEWGSCGTIPAMKDACKWNNIETANIEWTPYASTSIEVSQSFECAQTTGYMDPVGGF